MVNTRVMVVPSVLELLSTILIQAKARETMIWVILSPPLTRNTTVAVVAPPRVMVAPNGVTTADASNPPDCSGPRLSSDPPHAVRKESAIAVKTGTSRRRPRFIVSAGNE
jgi:hypothetical protein